MAFVRTDVTAVKFHNGRIFAGIGSYTKIFEKGSLRALQTVYTLKGQKIYGFVPSKCGRKVLCYGGKQFTVLLCPESIEGACERVFEPVICDDWLHSAVWLNDDKVAVLTAHNTVQLWDTSTQTLISHHPICDNSILYSGLLVPLENDVLVLSGTVFSEIIIRCYQGNEPLHRLKGHKGVIFSISCCLTQKIIVTTSDDRSVRIWSPNTEEDCPPYAKEDHSPNTKEFWEVATITCKYELYGHSGRVMRNCILDDYVISVGEDSAICYWNSNYLTKKITSVHQNSCIWSVDGDNDYLVTGGGDCSVMVHPLRQIIFDDSQIIETSIGNKKVAFTASRNLVMMRDDALIYYRMGTIKELKFNLNHTSTYNFLCMSPCYQFLAVADTDGTLDIFFENCKKDNFKLLLHTKLQIGNILSMHWGDNRHLVFCSRNGIVKILAKGNNELEVVSTVLLPASKERWLTAAAMTPNNNLVVLGDRCGNIHVYTKGQKDPIKSFRKVHGRYGPTSITIKDNEVITTGRDGTIRYFDIKDTEVKYMSSKNLDFQWVEKFLDRNENIVCGFHERAFVVYDIRNHCKLMEVRCGGGHRSWDAERGIQKVKDEYKEYINFVYIKNTCIWMGSLWKNDFLSTTVLNGSHCKEINCLKSYSALDDTKPFYISGGEDTTLRLSRLHSKDNFIDRILHKHLSNIRALKLYKLEDDKVLVISAGGRAQICFNILHFYKKEEDIDAKLEEILDYQLKGTDKEKKGNQNWRNCSVDFDPETRIMDVEAIHCENEEFLIVAGCSDAYLRVYKLNYEEKFLKPVNELKYHNTCILKTHIFNSYNNQILITTTTRGEVTLWKVSNIEQKNCEPFFTTTTNKSGVNSVDCKVISQNEVVIATGGDDNVLHLVLIKIQNNVTGGNILSSVHLDTLHGSQITGVCFSEEYLVTASIDQRVSLLKWKVTEEKISCEFGSQVFCDVADIQGIDLLQNSCESITVCVYGKGMEVINMNKVSPNRTK